MHPDEAAGVREQEERDGAAIVGVTEVDFGTHRDGNVEYGLDLRRDIAREIRRRKPDVVVTGHYGDRFVQGMLNQADHRAVGLATVSTRSPTPATGGSSPSWSTRGSSPGTSSGSASAGSPTATHFVDVGDHFDQSVASLEAHQAYNDALPDTFPKPAELIGMILGWGGQAAGVDKALTLDVVDRR